MRVNSWAADQIKSWPDPPMTLGKMREQGVRGLAVYSAAR